MINFNFNVRDVDAQNIIGILQDYVYQQEEKCMTYIMDQSKVGNANLQWTKGHIEYVKGLIKTMAESTTQV